jgi:putative transposase
VEAWRKIGLPRTLQLDNGMEFRGSNRYPRSFGKVLCLCTHLGVEPTFIPTREPGRNGLIENLNGQVSRLLLHAQYFTPLTDLQKAIADCEVAINSTHRLPTLEGRTPIEFAAQSTYRTLPYDFVFKDVKLPLDRGTVAFVRLIRKSGRITLFANDKFDIDPALHKHYVLARCAFPSRQLQVFSHSNALLKAFVF